MKRTRDALRNLKAKSDLIEARMEERKLDEFQTNFDTVRSGVPERIKIITEDFQKWECYVKTFDEMMDWIGSKKSIMELIKPKEKDEIDSQKNLLEVCS